MVWNEWLMQACGNGQSSLGVLCTRRAIRGEFISRLIQRQRPMHVCVIRITSPARNISLVEVHLCAIEIVQSEKSLLQQKGSVSFYSAGVTGSKSYLKSRSDPKGSVPNTWGTICQIHFLQSDRVYYPGEQPSSAEVSFLVRVSVCACVHVGSYRGLYVTQSFHSFSGLFSHIKWKMPKGLHSKKLNVTNGKCQSKMTKLANLNINIKATNKSKNCNICRYL